MSKLDDLLAQYWDAAYKEGEQCRIYDTEDGLAQTLLMQIKDEFSAAYRAGQEDMRKQCLDVIARVQFSKCDGTDPEDVNAIFCLEEAESIIRALEIKGEGE